MQIVTIVSALNGALYVSSRCIAALSAEGRAPAILGKINKRGVPWTALIFCNLFGFISLLNLSSSAGQLYSWLVNITGVATFITWGCICWCHIRFRKALQLQGISLDELPFRAALYPYGAWFGLLGNLFFIFFQGWTCFRKCSAAIRCSSLVIARDRVDTLSIAIQRLRLLHELHDDSRGE